MCVHFKHEMVQMFTGCALGVQCCGDTRVNGDSLAVGNFHQLVDVVIFTAVGGLRSGPLLSFLESLY